MPFCNNKNLIKSGSRNTPTDLQVLFCLFSELRFFQISKLVFYSQELDDDCLSRFSNAFFSTFLTKIFTLHSGGRAGGGGGGVGCSAFMPSVYRQGFEVKLGIALKGIMRTYKGIFLSSEREILCQIPLEKKINP